MSSRKRILYHCTADDHGPEMVVRRQTPRYPAKGEPRTPRLCVSPTVPQCFAARLFCESPVYVYRTEKPMRGVRPKNVWDEVLTDERWLLPGIRLVRCDVIDRAVVDSIGLDVAHWHEKTKKPATVDMRIAVIWRACVAIEEYAPKYLLRVASQWCEQKSIDPFDIFAPKPAVKTAF